MAQLVPMAEIISEQPPTATAAGPATMQLLAVEDPQVRRKKGCWGTLASEYLF